MTDQSLPTAAHVAVSDTVAAIATAPGIAGIGIVRVSGSLVPVMAEGILGGCPSPRHAVYRSFLAGDGSVLDQGIALYFPAPGSFTGEHVLELQGHGGPVVLDLVLSRCLELGARLARPGELTERAFLNGKLDLVQAEAIADLIESATALGARLALRSLQGAFSERISALVETLLRVRTHLEATLDFPEDDLEPDIGIGLARDLDALVADTRRVLGEAHRGERIRDGLRVVIAGPPNAGKSTLLNALTQTDAAIVTPIPGTTRDPLSVDIQIEGLPVRLTDTAGLRHTDDPIELEGVKRARQRMEEADLVLWVYDGSSPIAAPDIAALSPSAAVTLVCNKMDIPSARPSGPQRFPLVPVSALTGAGLNDLRHHLRERAGIEGLGEGAFSARRRHLDALRRGLADLEAARNGLAAGAAPELVAWDLRAAQQAFGEITGEVSSDDLLGRIFSTFCLGK